MHVSALDQTLIEAGCSSLSDGLADVGLGAIELSIDDTLELPPLKGEAPLAVDVGDDAALRAYRGQLYELGVQVSALAIRWVLPPAGWPKERAHGLAVLGALRAIGAGVAHLSLVWEEGPEPTPEQAVGMLAGALEPLLVDSEGGGVTFAIEAPDLAQDQPELCRCLLRGIDSERVGLTLDTGELYCAGFPLDEVYDLVREFAPHVRHVVCSNFRRPDELRGEYVELDQARELYACPLDRGDIDYARIASILGAVGYSAALTVNSAFRDGMEPEARQGMLRGDVAFLKDVLGQE